MSNLSHVSLIECPVGNLTFLNLVRLPNIESVRIESKLVDSRAADELLKFEPGDVPEIRVRGRIGWHQAAQLKKRFAGVRKLGEKVERLRMVVETYRDC